ncbi:MULTISPECIES: SDR family oxidoreductase [Microbacterium]|uniref:SDR family oxidoreductase n=1 Tax=Microbacterium TaxID=33882 RepID=UPI00217DC9BA|nr:MULTISPECIES: NAD(P)H-binding protein [Microbacterium]UWF78338.1 SDR family oxidoreductase [Microbacterium neungamense]WCM56515.1 SDR family oxidoreductase [Microbacterium sp. EF45047]
MDIAIAGATGAIGAAVARVAAERGHGVRTLARSTGVDILDGRGLDHAVRGSDVVIDVLNVRTQSPRKAAEFFQRTTTGLLEAEQRAEIGHHLALSIVGIDRAPYGYYAGKLAQERAVQAGAVPWTILRATQFHDFARQLFERVALGPLHPAIAARTQPVDLTELAVRIVDLAEAGPSGRVPDMAGPREEDLAAMMRAWAAHAGRRAWMPRVPSPGRFGRALRDGSILPGPDAQLGRVTFAEWLEAQPHV